MPRIANGSDDAFVVVGCGPVGMTAALALRARDVPVVLLESGPADRERPGSRAIYYHRQTLEQWNDLVPGLGWDVARRGLTWSTKQTYWRGELVYDRTYPPPDPTVLPPFCSLAQRDLERLLLDACKAAGVELAWEHEVAAVESSPDGVQLHTTSGASVRTPYVIAADGARSSVRGSLGIEMAGSRSEHHYVIVDVAEDPDRPLRAARIFHYEHPAVAGRNVLLVPFAGGWRADLQCRADDDVTEWEDEAGVRRWIGQVMPEHYAGRVEWVSAYRFLQVVAERFADEHRRVLLTGEAAHLFAPFGARGLNSGVPDAVAAADAIAKARQTPADAAAAVDEFASLRRAAAEYNREAAGTALRHMQAHGVVTRARRMLAARRALRGQRAGAWLDSAPYGPRARDRRGDAVY